MIQPTDVVIDNLKFQISMLDVLEAIVLDKRVTELVLPVMSALLQGKEGEVSPEARVNDPESMARLMDGILNALMKLDSSFMTELTQKLLRCVVTFIDGKGNVQLTERNDINTVFAGKFLTLYKLLLKVMEVNKFTPFALLASGFVMPGTSTLQGGMESKPKMK